MKCMESVANKARNIAKQRLKETNAQMNNIRNKPPPLMNVDVMTGEVISDQFTEHDIFTRRNETVVRNYQVLFSS